MQINTPQSYRRSQEKASCFVAIHSKRHSDHTIENQILNHLPFQTADGAQKTPYMTKFNVLKLHYQFIYLKIKHLTIFRFKPQMVI